MLSIGSAAVAAALVAVAAAVGTFDLPVDWLNFVSVAVVAAVVVPYQSSEATGKF